MRFRANDRVVLECLDHEPVSAVVVGRARIPCECGGIAYDCDWLDWMGRVHKVRVCADMISKVN